LLFEWGASVCVQMRFFSFSLNLFFCPQNIGNNKEKEENKITTSTTVD
jgi:hypothetical protein